MPARPLATLLALVAILTVPSAAFAQAGPADAYRAYWNSGLSPAAPEAARFRSEASLREIAAFLEEDPENARDALDFMAMLHGELYESADIAGISVVEETGDRATLEVHFEGRAGALPPGLPSRAAVQMVRENGGWKVDAERFTGGSPAVNAGPMEPEGDYCPAGTAVGDHGAPHMLAFPDPDGERRIHFGEAFVLRDGSSLSLRLPAVGESRISIDAPRGAEAPGSYPATLNGMRATGGCPALPEGLVYDDDARGTLEWMPGSRAGHVNVDFGFMDTGSGTPAFTGAVRDALLIDVSPGTLADDSRMVTMDGEEIRPDRGGALLYQEDGRLEVSVAYSTSSGGGSSSFTVPDFSGEAGVYVGDPFFDDVRVVVVRAFDGTRLDMEVRKVAVTDLPAGELTPDVAAGLGSLVARVVTDRVVVIPALQPL
jgi:hypothetical protein